MIDYDKMIKFQKKVWDEYRIIHPEFPYECYMMSAVKSVSGSILLNLLPENKDIIINAYYEEKESHHPIVIDALKDIDYENLFIIINNINNSEKESDLY